MPDSIGLVLPPTYLPIPVNQRRLPNAIAYRPRPNMGPQAKVAYYEFRSRPVSRPVLMRSLTEVDHKRPVLGSAW